MDESLRHLPLAAGSSELVELPRVPKGYMTRGMVWTRPHLNPNGDDFRRRGCQWNGSSQEDEGAADIERCTKWERVPPGGGDGTDECWRGKSEEMLRRNDDAGNMSPTDTRIGIPESASYRPEAHVFPFPCRVSDRDFFSSPLRIGFCRRILLDVYVYAHQRIWFNNCKKIKLLS